MVAASEANMWILRRRNESSVRGTHEQLEQLKRIQRMGGICSEGHVFIRICRKRNSDKVELMLDVTVTQHSRWTRGVACAFCAQATPRASRAVVDTF